ncbi:hypothetical protein CROQUDRAFT_101503 [Cronartium quercuum f. sp. fusiforme G11]|uniref:Uncharacterized protein n=1 Tax=Cronartium quercuum f. sp. fusiforme G11 TaxID=708437 RepID=A0A9P6T5A4_9BASI|nr:hypothetical protein CROQUDRAFT_101503 [Cronartium quercuum f. sp. fusiforme G11]
MLDELYPDHQELFMISSPDFEFIVNKIMAQHNSLAEVAPYEKPEDDYSDYESSTDGSNEFIHSDVDLL